MSQKYSRITRQIGISFLSNSLVFIFAPILILMLTRSLSVAEFGVYSLLSITVAVCTVIFDLSLSHYIISKFSGIEREKKLSGFFSIYLFEFVLVAAIISLIMFTPAFGFLASVLKLETYGLELRLTFFIVFMMVLLRLKSAFYVSEKRLELGSIIAFLQQCLWIIIFIAYFFAAKNISLKAVFIIWLIGTAITFIFSLANIGRGFLSFAGKRIAVNEIYSSLLFSVPLLPFAFGSYIIAMSDRYVLNYYSGQAVVGLYTLAYSLSWLPLSIAVIVGEVFRPYIAEAWNRKEDYNVLFNASLKYGLIAILPLLTGLFILREQIVTLISGTEYLASASVIPLLIAGPLFELISYLFYQPLMLKGKTKIIGAIFLFGALLNLALNFALIPRYGMNGAAIATVASYFMVFMLAYCNSKKDFAIEWRYIKLKKTIAAALIMGVMLYLALQAFRPEAFAEKMLLILFGGVLYIGMILALRVFDDKEMQILKNFILKKTEKKEDE